MVLNGKSLHDLLMLVSEVAIPGFPFFRLYVKGISDYIFLIILLYVLMILLCTGNVTDLWQQLEFASELESGLQVTCLI